MRTRTLSHSDEDTGDGRVVDSGYSLSGPFSLYQEGKKRMSTEESALKGQVNGQILLYHLF